MSIANSEVLRILDEISNKIVHYCLICGNKCSCNVCVECEAKSEARKVLFYCYDILKKMENRIINVSFREHQQKTLIEYWNQKANYSDLSCYTDSERQIIHDVFWGEIKSLLENQVYYDLVFKPENGKRTVQPQNVLENLRLENIHNMCLECNQYPCRYVRDIEMSLSVIKKCSDNKRGVVSK